MFLITLCTSHEVKQIQNQENGEYTPAQIDPTVTTWWQVLEMPTGEPCDLNRMKKNILCTIISWILMNVWPFTCCSVSVHSMIWHLAIKSLSMLLADYTEKYPLNLKIMYLIFWHLNDYFKSLILKSKLKLPSKSMLYRKSYFSNLYFVSMATQSLDFILKIFF